MVIFNYAIQTLDENKRFSVYMQHFYRMSWQECLLIYPIMVDICHNMRVVASINFNTLNRIGTAAVLATFGLIETSLLLSHHTTTCITMYVRDIVHRKYCSLCSKLNCWIDRWKTAWRRNLSDFYNFDSFPNNWQRLQSIRKSNISTILIIVISVKSNNTGTCFHLKLKWVYNSS